MLLFPDVELVSQRWNLFSRVDRVKSLSICSWGRKAGSLLVTLFAVAVVTYWVLATGVLAYAGAWFTVR